MLTQFNNMFISFFSFFTISIKIAQNWFNLRTPLQQSLNGFKQQPRTVSEAEEAGWTKVDSDDVGCKNVNGGA